MAMKRLIRRLIDFVENEFQAQKEATLTIWNKSVEERLKDGEVIADIRIVENHVTELEVVCKRNNSKFREGSRLRLHRGNPQAGFACEIVRDRGTSLTLKAGFRTAFWDVKGEGWLLDIDLIDTRRILIETLETLQHHTRMYASFHGMLKGDILPSATEAALKRGQKLAEGIGFNDKQREAFVNAYASKPYYLVQGPPGTGKTWLLAHLATSFAKEGKNVLITGFTHRSINNALRKIVQVTGYEEIAKIGQKINATDLAWNGGKVSNYEYFYHSPYSLRDKGLILGGTCFAARTRRLSQVSFDVIIFDEAGQMTLPLAFAGMMSGQKFIYIGDHKQMPPVITAEHEDQNITQSIFECLYKHAPGTMLNTTYRMNAAINAFPSKHFYANGLKTFADNAYTQLHLKRMPKRLHNILDPKTPALFVEIPHKKNTLRSKEEASLIVEIVEQLLYCGVPSEEIAVVAAFRAQGRLIRAMLRKELEGQYPKALDDIVVDTVERMQGQEREVILISLITSDPKYAARRAEFIFQPNRLNVALTRPKYKRIVLGSRYLFEAKPEGTVYQGWLHTFRSFFLEEPKIHM